MENNLKGKVALITGASGGIGSSLTENLAKLGVNLILLGGRNLKKLEDLKLKVQSFGVKCLALSGDLTDINFINSGVELAVQSFGGIDILINNAGLAQSTPFEQISKEEFESIMTLNFKVPFFLTQKLVPILKKSNYATIINIASVVGHMGYPLQSVYTASKHALVGFSKSLAKEVYKDGIRVHVLSPGGVYTDMIKVSRPDLSKEGMIMPEDISNIVLFLLQNRTNAVIDQISLHRVNKEPFLD